MSHLHIVWKLPQKVSFCVTLPAEWVNNFLFFFQNSHFFKIHNFPKFTFFVTFCRLIFIHSDIFYEFFQVAFSPSECQASIKVDISKNVCLVLKGVKKIIFGNESVVKSELASMCVCVFSSLLILADFDDLAPLSTLSAHLEWCSPHLSFPAGTFFAILPYWES